MRECRIEILMTTYNGASYLKEQLDSILAQTYRNWHLTVSDDGSTDATVSIIQAYERAHPDKIRRVRYPERFGSPKAHFLRLCRDCDAPLMAFCDQDDVWFVDKLAKMAAKAMQYEQNTPLLVFSDQIPTDAFLHPLSDSVMKMSRQYTAHIEWQAVLFRNTVTGGACLFNRALALLACRCEDDADIIMHDWWLAAVAARFGNLLFLNEPTGFYRQHEHNYIGAKNVKRFSYIWSRIRDISDVKRSILLRKTQARQMLETYREMLTESDKRFLECFAKKHSGALFYFKNLRYIHGFLRALSLLVMG
ncbi:MAG: glycosyltransferase family 2 protein [Clostridia bacterium]|nr:glycosyltransferase family 2 protein [Clostridia bacterium]